MFTESESAWKFLQCNRRKRRREERNVSPSASLCHTEKCSPCFCCYLTLANCVKIWVEELWERERESCYSWLCRGSRIRIRRGTVAVVITNWRSGWDAHRWIKPPWIWIQGSSRLLEESLTASCPWRSLPSPPSRWHTARALKTASSTKSTKLKHSFNLFALEYLLWSLVLVLLPGLSKACNLWPVVRAAVEGSSDRWAYLFDSFERHLNPKVPSKMPELHEGKDKMECRSRHSGPM